MERTKRAIGHACRTFVFHNSVACWLLCIGSTGICVHIERVRRKELFKRLLEVGKAEILVCFSGAVVYHWLEGPWSGLFALQVLVHHQGKSKQELRAETWRWIGRETLFTGLLPGACSVYFLIQLDYHPRENMALSVLEPSTSIINHKKKMLHRLIHSSSQWKIFLSESSLFSGEFSLHQVNRTNQHS